MGAVQRQLGDAVSKTAISSTKTAIGHLLGSAGSVEAIFTLLAMRDAMVPPTINLDNPDVSTRIDLVPKAAQKRKVDIAMSNSFGFGGTNAALIFCKA
jgi:3-oxoacyl-[acyl-carrier-protein] synthase II